MVKFFCTIPKTAGRKGSKIEHTWLGLYIVKSVGEEVVVTLRKKKKVQRETLKNGSNKKGLLPGTWSRLWFAGVRVRLKCYYAFFLVCCGCDTSYIVSVQFQCQVSTYTLSLCHGHS